MTNRIICRTYVEGSQHWANLCIFHASWLHIQYSGHLVWRGPTASLRTRSNTSAMTRSKWQSC